jgi:MOSC domain-containing protein YiiM
MAAGEKPDAAGTDHPSEMLNGEHVVKPSSCGQLFGIASRPARRAPMQEVTQGLVTAAAGLASDFKGRKYPRRQITVLSREAWEAALDDAGVAGLPWTMRRANLLVGGVRLPRAAGGIIRIGSTLLLEVTGQTYPCQRMEEAGRGLLSALAKDWRGGITARVLEGGFIATGDSVEVLVDPPEIRPRLPE